MSFLNRFLEFPPQDDTLHSVIRNLSYLLNSRPGYGSRLREYGVGDYLAQQGKKAAQLTILREIRDDIAVMEPRFRLRDITATGRDAELRLQICVRGTLLTKTGPRTCALRVQFHLPSGEVTVEEDSPLGGADAS
jgi:predicted component of type VI protein secretion system